METTALDRAPLGPVATPMPAAIGSPPDGFGVALGDALADFVCTYKRLRGRLYATSDAVLFQSNLLGFETKISVLWSDVISMELCRTTSIELSLYDGEVYTFRSFHNRGFVLELLKTLKASHDERYDDIRPMALIFSPNRHPVLRSLTSDPTALSRLRSSLPLSPSTPLFASAEEESWSSSGETPLRSNRRRSASESNVKSPISTAAVFEQDTAMFETAASSDAEGKSSSQTQITSEHESDSAEERSWRAALEMKHDIGVEHIGIDSLQLPCTLQHFHRHFLADGAPHGLDRFQRERIGDVNLRLTPWTDDGAGFTTRTLTFLHPLKPSAGMGPSEARTSRRQKLRWHGGWGLALENTTVVEGVPAADCFFVRDHWLVEALPGGDAVRLEVRFGTHFHRRSLLRSFIEKSVTMQTVEWFSGYSRMLQEALGDKTLENGEMKNADEQKVEIIPEVTVAIDHLAHLEQKLLLLSFIVALLVVTCITMGFQLVSMYRSILVLSSGLASLKGELRDAPMPLVASDGDDILLS